MEEDAVVVFAAVSYAVVEDFFGASISKIRRNRYLLLLLPKHYLKAIQNEVIFWMMTPWLLLYILFFQLPISIGRCGLTAAAAAAVVVVV